MRYLLDTHTFLWFINGDRQLSEKAKKAIDNPDAIKRISIASLWEIAIKLNIGKLKIDMTFENLWQQIDKNGFELLPIKFEHTLELCSLELHHRDPFDRMIIAQSLVEDLTLISKDSNVAKYEGLRILW